MTITRKCAAAVFIVAKLVQRNKRRNNKKRRWVKDWIRQREIENTAQNLIRDLRKEEDNSFKQFFRTSPDQFDILLELIRPVISKRDTHLRKAISADARLAITLRYLSSGDSYRSLMLLFRVPHNTISGIVPETCKAIYMALCENYLKVRKARMDNKR